MGGVLQKFQWCAGAGLYQLVQPIMSTFPHLHVGPPMAWNHSWWEHLEHRYKQVLQIKVGFDCCFSGKPVLVIFFKHIIASEFLGLSYVLRLSSTSCHCSVHHGHHHGHPKVGPLAFVSQFPFTLPKQSTIELWLDFHTDLRETQWYCPLPSLYVDTLYIHSYSAEGLPIQYIPSPSPCVHLLSSSKEKKEQKNTYFKLYFSWAFTALFSFTPAFNPGEGRVKLISLSLCALVLSCYLPFPSLYIESYGLSLLRQRPWCPQLLLIWVTLRHVLIFFMSPIQSICDLKRRVNQF